jgi:thiopeptide-type bacteriocin biosynthesis protein
MVIAELLPVALAAVAPRRWFFVRYRDEIGLHVRLRLAVENARLAAASAQLERILERSTTSPLKLGGFERENYVPEVGKFGMGIGIAEEVFHVSSEAALQVICEERQGVVSRKTVAPILMQCVADAYVNIEAQGKFWGRYAEYWLSFDHDGAARWRALYLSKAEELAQTRASVMAASETLDVVTRQCIDVWSAALRESAQRFSAIRQGDERRRSELAFHFIHLMNNRIGVLAIAEAYVATLLAQRLDRSIV